MAIQTKTVLVLPDEERGLPPDQVKRWDKAKGRLTSPLTKEAARDEAVRSLDFIETHPKKERDRKWRASALAETIKLAKDRGEEIDAGSVSKDGQRRTPVRRLSSGGLHEAFRRGTLGDDGKRSYELVRIGDLYRDCYERDMAMGTAERSEGGSSGSPRMAQSALLHAGQVLAVLRTGLSELELAVLDKVCGTDLNLKLATKEIGKRPTTVSAALRSGLERAADNWNGKDDDDVRPKQYWDGLSATIAKAQKSVA